MNGTFDQDLLIQDFGGLSFAEAVLQSSGAGIAYVGGNRINDGGTTMAYLSVGKKEIVKTIGNRLIFIYKFTTYHCS